MENYIPVHSTPIQYTGHPSQVDVAVLILFFNRPEPLSAVFEQVRKARPSKLFLYQDINGTRKRISAATRLNIFPRNGLFLLSRNASYLKTMTYLPSTFLLSVRNYSTDMKTIAASA